MKTPIPLFLESRLMHNFVKVTSFVVAVTSSFALAAEANAKQPKFDVCKITGNGSIQIINVAAPALADLYASGFYPSFDGFCYALGSGSATFMEAEQSCQDDFGGHLASIHSSEEDAFISGLVDPQGIGGITAWIGGFAEEGFEDGPGALYEWTDGTHWDYANWRSSTDEPNGDDPPAAVQFWPTNSANGDLSGWNDVSQAVDFGNYVCKF
jgi:hypothetical protein